MKNKTWVKRRHGIVRAIANAVLSPYARIKYGVKIEKFKEQKGRQYLIVTNHQTAFDQFFIGMVFKGAVYYVASEDLFSKGWISSLIRYLVAPIPIKKQTTDVKAVINCMRVAKEGGTIALAPEGNRTYSGRLVHINPAIGALAKKLKLPIAVFRIEGGYGVQPRWSDVVRRGKMRAYVHSVIEPEEYENMSSQELYELIKEEINVDEVNADSKYYHKKLAEYLERAIYVCPYCGLAHLESHNDIIKCKDCGREIRYLPTKELQGVNFEFPFRFVADWYQYQEDYINSLDLSLYKNKPAYEDTGRLSEVIVYKNKKLIEKTSNIKLYGDRITFTVGEDLHVLSFDDITAMTVLGKNKLNFYFDKKLYQIKSDKRFNAIKYINFYYHYTNLKKGENDVKFLGL